MKANDTILRQKFETLFREYFTGLTHFAQKYLGDLDSSKEVVHNVFIKIWENRHDFEWEKPAKSYLFTSVYNRSLNVIRDNKKFASAADDEVHAASLETGEFTDTMEVAELETRIQQALKKLPGKCREVFELNRFQGKKYKEIAEHLNISIKTVETQMSKALKVLKEELKDYIYLVVMCLFLNGVTGDSRNRSACNPPDCVKNVKYEPHLTSGTLQNRKSKIIANQHQGKSNLGCVNVEES